MDWIFELLFGWWFYGKGGQTKTASAADKFVMPFLILCLLVALVLLLAWVVRK